MHQQSAKINNTFAKGQNQQVRKKNEHHLEAKINKTAKMCKQQISKEIKLATFS